MFSFLFYFTFPIFLLYFHLPLVSPPQDLVALSVRTRPQLRAELADPAGTAGRPPTLLNLQLLSRPAACTSHRRLHRKSSPTLAPRVTSHIPSVLAQRKVALVDLPLQASLARGEPKSSFPIHSSPFPCSLI
jgi:hypothetical protein